ncbi:MAG: D-alanyl-D-alanine carboxypeptidase/D-alanyl-D-alanine-endopeptidase [Myxococcales bacterium]|nr:D-alanyl-D-alanine carboxypeptidase/D-alanyl-D-alanine-endopeptidase [Myxococcales bacterium]
MLALVGASIVTPRARSQAADPPPVDGDAGVAAPAPESDEDDQGDDGGVALPPAPADPAARRAWLTQQLDGAVAAAPALARAAIGAVVVDVTTGEVLWGHDADRPQPLASVQKVLTTTAALRALGPSFRWRTTIYGEQFDPATGVVDGDLIVRGRGDPTFGSRDLAVMARDLRWRGVETVTGDLVFDGSYFDDVDEPPRYADQPKERAGYRAPIAAASLERNAVTVVVVADRVGLGLARVSLDPPGGDHVRLIEDGVVTVATGRTRISVGTTVKRDHLELRVSGQIAAADAVWFGRRRIDDPTAQFGEALRIALADAGIRVRGKRLVRRALAPTAKVTILAEHESAALADVVRAMAKASDNFLAETVLKTIGAEARAAAGGGPATWADGLAVVHQLLVDAGAPAGGFRVENGSGLYDASSVSASAVAKVLVAGWRDFRVGPELASALAIGGVDGTLRRRFTGPEVRGRVRGKTGTLAAVSSLAGLAGADGLHPLAFVVLIDALPAGTRPVARQLQDAIATAALAYASR